MNRKRPYHHGNLKPALLRAATELIAEVGPAAFALREVARRAGISHNAPYRHFRDKDELLASVATEGFERLAGALSEAACREGKRANGRDQAPRRLQASGVGYVKFALQWPEHLLVMFDWPLPMKRCPEVAEAGERAFGVLVKLIEERRRKAACRRAIRCYRRTLRGRWFTA